MAKRVELEIAPREVIGKANKRLRGKGVIPANIFGRNKKSQAVQVEILAFDRLRRAHGTRHILALKLPKGQAQTALIRHVQHDPVTREIIHIDFYRVSMEDQITVKIPLQFVGEAPAVKIEKGVMLHLLDALEVRCKASDIVERLEVDVSPLTEFEASLHASDVQLPSGYTLITDPAESIVKVAAPRVELPEEEEAAEETKEEAEAAPEAAETPAAEE